MFLVVFAVFFAETLRPRVMNGTLNDPPSPGDGPEYDSIALNLARGRGYSVIVSDPEWRSPYETYKVDKSYIELLTRENRPVLSNTTRPPAMPWMIAVLYGVGGRNFALWRIANAVIAALAVAFAAAWAYRIAGMIAAVATLAFSMIDPIFLWLARDYWTEPLAALGVLAFVAALLAFRRVPGLWYAALVGLTLGVMWYVRTAFVMWLGFLPVILWLLRPRDAGRLVSSRRLRNAAIDTAIAVAVALAITAPWMIRNCAVLGMFMPNGANAPMALEGGFSDRALQKRGVWFNPIKGDNASERDIALREKAKAKAWIREHLADMPRLAAWKVVSEWWPWLSRRWPILLLAALGAWALRRHPLVMCVAFAVVATTLGVAMTWAVAGRFVAPLHPLIHLFAGVGAWSVIAHAWRRASGARPAWLFENRVSEDEP